MAYWKDNADSYICSNCGFECNNPNELPYGAARCPKCMISMCIRTNADRIRAMRDEELAEFIDKVHAYPCEVCCNNLNVCRRNNAIEPVCKRHYLDWLQQPAEED